MEVKVFGNHLKLLPERAIYLKELQAILIADVHFGKTTHFRKAGIAVPANIISDEIKRLQKLIDQHEPKEVYFLGDLFHSHLNHEWEMLLSFIANNSDVAFVLVKGNHDILPVENYNQTNFTMVEEPFLLENLSLSHHPMPASYLKNKATLLHINGHLHPGMKVKGKAKTFFKLPCFHFQTNQLILPAFGRFTGLAAINHKKNDTVYCIANDKIIEVK